MKSEWTAEIKPEILANIEKAGIENKEFVKLLLRFERRLNTTLNKLYSGMSWNNVCHEYSYNEAGQILEYYFTNRPHSEKGKYYELYCKYCAITGTCPTSTLEDYLA